MEIPPAKFSDSPDKIPSSDKGADTQRRFSYQHSCVTLLLVQMCRENINYKEILCEQHEDALAIDINEKFIGIQIKTREDGKPFSLYDNEIKKSIKRFILHEDKFPDQFGKYIIVSNCGINNETLGLIKALKFPSSQKLQLRVRGTWLFARDYL